MLETIVFSNVDDRTIKLLFLYCRNQPVTKTRRGIEITANDRSTAIRSDKSSAAKWGGGGVGGFKRSLVVRLHSIIVNKLDSWETHKNEHKSSSGFVLVRWMQNSAYCIFAHPTNGNVLGKLAFSNLNNSIIQQLLLLGLVNRRDDQGSYFA